MKDSSDSGVSDSPPIDELSSSRTGETIKVSLSSTALSNLTFDDCIFVSSSLHEVSLEGCVFENTSFRGVTFTECDIVNTQFINCVFDDIKIVDSTIDRSRFESSLMRKGAIEYTNATGIDFLASSFFETSFSHSKLEYSLWKDSRLIGSDFSSAKMEGARFTNVDLHGSVFKSTEMKATKFHEVKFTETNFSSAVLYDADFNGGDSMEAVARFITEDGAEFLGAKVLRPVKS